MTNSTYEQRLQRWMKARFAAPPVPDLTPFEPTQRVMMPMRDGVRLYTELFLPSREGPHPVVLLRSPYPFTRPSLNDRWPISRYLEAGFAFAFQLTRGQGESEGAFRFMLDEAQDGFDCIEWLARQPWCNGRVGMEGSSYSGGNQLLAARTKPPSLKCIAPTAFVGDYQVCYPFSGGVPLRGVLMQWHRLVDAEALDELDFVYGDMAILKHPTWGPALRRRPMIDAADEVLAGDKLVSWKAMMSSPLVTGYWQPVHFTDDDLAALEIPMLITDGWFDLTVGPLDYFERLERLRPGDPDRYLVVGPWDHAQVYGQHLHANPHGERPTPANGTMDLVGTRLAFFDRYLRDNRAAEALPDRVRVYVTGIDRWLDASTFPLPGTEVRNLYLRSGGDARSLNGDGSLSWEAPADEAPDSYVYDPALPTPGEAEFFRDRREIEVRSDTLVYTSEPFDEPITILGDITLVLYAASDGPDTDWFAHLTEVFPDGRSIAFHGALPALRARYRCGFDREVPLVPNEPTRFEFSLRPAGHRLAPGSRLRLTITSAYFPSFDPNTNTGLEATTDTDARVARQTVFHDAALPSHIRLPLVRLT